MIDLINSIVSKDYVSADSIISETVELIVTKKLMEAKKKLAAELCDEETEQLDEARVRIIKARIRGGQIQRRKRVSNVPGMTLRGGKLKRMSTAERRRRKMGAKRAVRKRAPKMNRILMKRTKSLRKRKAMGL